MEFVGIDKLSLLDYDGYVSCVLFAPTCNFRCPFCHNGESVLNTDSSIPFADIRNYLHSRQGIIDAVTISGGEPTLMDNLEQRIIYFREMGLKIKLDTNGSNPDVLRNLLDKNLLDYVAMDIKNSPNMYPVTTGCKCININRIKESIDMIMNSGVDYEFRTTLVDDFHSPDSIKEMGEFIKGAKRLFLQKFVDREGVIQHGLTPVSIDKANEYKEILSNYVNSCELRGY